MRLNRLKTRLPQIASVSLAVLLALGLLVFNRFNRAESEAKSPEKRITDLNNVSKTSFNLNESAYLILRSYAEDVPDPDTGISESADVKIYEKLASQANYKDFIEAKDKGGRTYSPRLTVGVDGQLLFEISDLPENYLCNSGETVCETAGTKITSGSNAGRYQISNNYLDIRVKVTFVSGGEFDLDSNYTGCGSGQPIPCAECDQKYPSRVEYFNPYVISPSNEPYETFNFPSLCISIGSSNLNVMKTSYDKDGNKKASFEAGEEATIKLEIMESDGSREDYKIEDFVPGTVASGTEVNFKLSRPKDSFDGVARVSACESNGQSKCLIISGTSNENELKDKNFAPPFLQGLNTIEYKLKI